VDVVKEFALWTRRELNFEIEANNAIRLKEEMKNNSNVMVPKVFLERSSKRVLTLEFVEGFKISNLAALKKNHISTKKIAMTYFTSLLEQGLMYGLFHADPHPANIFIQKNGKLVYLDYGIMGEISSADRKKVIRFVKSLPEKNADKSFDIIISLAKDTTKADIPMFKEEAIPIMREVYESATGGKSLAKAFYKVISLGAKYGVIFNPDHVLLAKMIYQGEGIGMKLDPHFKVAEGLEIFSQKYLQETYSPRKIAKRVKRTLWDNKELLLELPEHLSKLIKRLEQPGTRQESNRQRLHELEHELEYLNRKQNAGIILAALIVGSAVIFYMEKRATIFGVPLSFMFAGATIILVLYLVSIRKKSED